jgi:hypothetical protein
MTKERSLTSSNIGTITSGNNLDPERLRFITQSFTWPRGLYFVAYGAWFGAWQFGAVYWKESEGSWREALWFLTSSAVPFFVSIIWIPRYYMRRFGLFRPKPGPIPSPWSKKRMLALVLIILGVYFLTTIVEHLTQTRVDLVRLLSPFVLLGYVLLDPWRKLRSMMEMTVFALWAIILALFALLPLWAPDTVPTQLWKAFLAALTGIGCVTIGLYDHITLTRLLPKRVEQGDHE